MKIYYSLNALRAVPLNQAEFATLHHSLLYCSSMKVRIEENVGSRQLMGNENVNKKGREGGRDRYHSLCCSVLLCSGLNCEL